MDKNKITVKRGMTPGEAAKYLEDFIGGMKAGLVVVEQGEERLTLSLPKLIQVEVSAKTKKDEQKFSLELEWETETGQDMLISGAGPEAAKPCCDAGKKDPEAAAQPAKEKAAAAKAK